MDNPKMFYCFVGGGQFVIPKDNIIVKSDLLIHASKVYFVAPQQSSISGAGGKATITVGVTPFTNAFLQCNFICDLLEEDHLYKEMIKLLKTEGRLI